MFIDLSALPVLKLAGDIDSTHSHVLLEAVENAVAMGYSSMSLDLSGAAVADTGGVKVLLKCRKQAESKGCELKIESAREDTVRMLQLCGLAELFGVPPLEKPSFSGERLNLQYADWNMHESVAVSEPEMIGPLREVARVAALEAGLDQQGIMDIEIAVGEALANAVRHGSPQGSSSKVRLRCLACSRAIVFEITDEGEDFDFEHVVASSPDGEEGIGLRLISRAMDEVEWLRVGSGNQVRLIRWLTP